MKILLLEPSIYMTAYYRSMIYAPRDLVLHLANGLVDRGHAVTLAAAADVETKATLLPGDPGYIKILEAIMKNPSLSDDEKQKQAFMIKRDFETDLWTRAFQKAITEKFDIAHVYHIALGHYFEAFLPDTPVVYTLHDPLPKPNTLGFVVFTKFSHHFYVSISDAQRRSEDLPLNFVDTVYHGVRLSEFPFIDHPSDLLLFMGRLVPEKGLHDAIAAAIATVTKLIIGTQFPREHEGNPYFEEKIKPFLDNPLIEEPGLVEESEKARLYGNAKVLLFPIHWEEPFGMVMIEAMACGTPVIAYNRGSVPEIVRDGVTGFIIEPNLTNLSNLSNLTIKKTGIEGLVEAVRRIGEIDRAACRRHVEEHFTVEKMVEGYERVYQKVLGG